MKKVSLSILMVFSLVFSVTAQRNDTSQSATDDVSNLEASHAHANLNDISLTTRSSSSSLNEDFEGDLFPPLGWTVINEGDPSTFYKSQRGVLEGTGCVSIWYDENELAHDDYLITPKLEISAGNTTLSAFFATHNFIFPEPYDVMVSTTGTEAGDFVLFQAEADPGNYYVLRTYDFSSYMDQEIYVAFRSTTAFAHALYIDNVTGPPVAFSASHDLLVSNITPPSTLMDSFVPRVTVTNFSTSDESSYTVVLTNGGTYNETINGTTTIVSGEELYFYFPVFTPEIDGSMTFTATVTVTGDEDTTNDILTKDIYVYNPIFEQHDFVNAPGAHDTGADVSMLEQEQTGLGKGFNFSQGFVLADDFIVQEGLEWTVNGFRFFAYQTGSTLLSTMYGMYLKIYSGHPDEGGTIIADFGDENLRVSSKWSNSYRMETGDYSGTLRPMMEIIGEIPELVLEPGEYWVSVGAMGSLGKKNSPQNGPYMAHLQLESGNTNTGNAIRIFQGVVMDWNDVGVPQGMPFDVFGSIEGELGVQENDILNSSILLYPNPTQDIINIENTSDSEIISIKLYDPLGRLVLDESEFYNNQLQISHLQNGLLFVKIETDNGIVTKKIIKI